MEWTRPLVDFNNELVHLWTYKSSFVETNIYASHIWVTPLIMINACISEKIVLKKD